MLSRPVDASGDILPVLALSDLATEPTATASALRDHLSLLPGDWWEYPSRGNQVVSLLPEARATPASAATLAAYLSAYIESFPSVASVSVVSTEFSGRQFIYTAEVHLSSGESEVIHFAFP